VLLGAEHHLLLPPFLLLPYWRNRYSLPSNRTSAWARDWHVDNPRCGCPYPGPQQRSLVSSQRRIFLSERLSHFFTTSLTPWSLLCLDITGFRRQESQSKVSIYFLLVVL
jgi:hypothetical protein